MLPNDALRQRRPGGSLSTPGATAGPDAEAQSHASSGLGTAAAGWNGTAASRVASRRRSSNSATAVTEPSVFMGKSPGAIGAQALLAVAAAAAAVVLVVRCSEAWRGLPNPCIMTTSSPQYIEIPSETSALGQMWSDRGNGDIVMRSRLAGRYRLVRFLHRQKVKSADHALIQHPEGTPVLFVPGHLGSFAQVRSLGRLGEDAASKLAFYAIDFREEPSALSGAVLMDQAEFVRDAIDVVRRLHGRSRAEAKAAAGNKKGRKRSAASGTPGAKAPPPSLSGSGLPLGADGALDEPQLTIVAHSMGGLAARAALTLPGYTNGSVSTIVTLSSPHQRAPIPADWSVNAFYSQVNGAWRAAASTYDPATRDGGEAAVASGATAAAGDSLAALRDVALVSISGGDRDQLVHTRDTVLDGLVPDGLGYHVVLNDLFDVGISADHQAVLWCKQAGQVVTRALSAVADRCDVPAAESATAAAVAAARQDKVKNKGSAQRKAKPKTQRGAQAAADADADAAHAVEAGMPALLTDGRRCTGSERVTTLSRAMTRHQSDTMHGIAMRHDSEMQVLVDGALLVRVARYISPEALQDGVTILAAFVVVILLAMGRLVDLVNQGGPGVKAGSNGRTIKAAALSAASARDVALLCLLTVWPGEHIGLLTAPLRRSRGSGEPAWIGAASLAAVGGVLCLAVVAALPALMPSALTHALATVLPRAPPMWALAGSYAIAVGAVAVLAMLSIAMSALTSATCPRNRSKVPRPRAAPLWPPPEGGVPAPSRVNGWVRAAILALLGVFAVLAAHITTGLGIPTVPIAVTTSVAAWGTLCAIVIFVALFFAALFTVPLGISSQAVVDVDEYDMVPVSSSGRSGDGSPADDVGGGGASSSYHSGAHGRALGADASGVVHIKGGEHADEATATAASCKAALQVYTTLLCFAAAPAGCALQLLRWATMGVPLGDPIVAAGHTDWGLASLGVGLSWTGMYRALVVLAPVCAYLAGCVWRRFTLSREPFAAPFAALLTPVTAPVEPAPATNLYHFGGTPRTKPVSRRVKALGHNSAAQRVIAALALGAFAYVPRAGYEAQEVLLLLLVVLAVREGVAVRPARYANTPIGF